MGKLLVMDERDQFHRVWNFVVPWHEIGIGRIQSIPPLTKNSFRKKRRKKTKNAC
jgi:hypothetical protein